MGLISTGPSEPVELRKLWPTRTQSDIEKLIPTQELAELTTESGSTPDAAVITEAIAKADAEIDSYLGVIYTVPLSVSQPGSRHSPRISPSITCI